MTHGDDAPVEKVKKPKKSKKGAGRRPDKIPNDVYEAELFRLQTELVKLQTWVRATGARIVVLDKGRLHETGTHAELVARGGIYADLWTRQSGGFIADDTAEPEVAAE